MEFSSLYFLYLLLPLTLLMYFLLPDVGRKNAFLIVVSLVLYGFCRPLCVPLLILLCRMNFSFAKRIRKGSRRTVLLPVFLNLAVLVLLRYIDPIFEMLGKGTPLLSLTAKLTALVNKSGLTLRAPTTLVPLGLAFFTLTSISYLVDVYRGKYRAERVFSRYLLHMVMFPKLFQGPIVRYEQTAVSLKERRMNERQILEGAVRFATGLGKKVLLADPCGAMIAELTAAGSERALVGSWLIAVLFFFQIYYDFSACCDMAIGLGRIFGFRFPENFDLPYTAISVTDFCERWNLTLGAFFRDYVYTPLCKDPTNQLRGFVALPVTAVLAGLWHGASYTFAIFGLYFAALVLLEKFANDFIVDLPYWLRRTLTILAVLFGWVILRNPSPEALGQAVKAMIGDGGVQVLGDMQRVENCIPLIAACWVGATSLPKQLKTRWRSFCGVGKKNEAAAQPLLQLLYPVSCAVFILLMLWWCTVARTGYAVQPSIFMNL